MDKQITILAGTVQEGAILEVSGKKCRLEFIDVGTGHTIELKNLETGAYEKIRGMLGEEFSSDLLHAKIIKHAH